MFYKKEKNGNWLKGFKVILPNGDVLTKENQIIIDGWEWHDTAPQEYIIWEQSQNNV